MFWTLLAAVLFTFSPFAVKAIHGETPPAAKIDPIVTTGTNPLQAELDSTKAQLQQQQFISQFWQVTADRNALAAQLLNAQKQVEQLTAERDALKKVIESLKVPVGWTIKDNKIETRTVPAEPAKK